MGAHATSSIGRTVSPSVASKKVAPLAFSLPPPDPPLTLVARTFMGASHAKLRQLMNTKCFQKKQCMQGCDS